MKNISLYGLLVVILAGCASQQAATTSHSGSKYSEDLSVWRPMVEARVDTTHARTTNAVNKGEVLPAQLAVNGKLDAVLDTINQIYRSRRTIDGYTIQVFSGDKDGALEAKKQLALALPDMESELNFITPTFRVKVGQYFTRMDAQRDFMAVKRHFPSAIVIPEKVAMN